MLFKQLFETFHKINFFLLLKIVAKFGCGRTIHVDLCGI